MRTYVALVALIGLAWPLASARAQEMEAVPDSITPERVLAGSVTFNGGSCIVCHAVAGRGSGRWAPDLSDGEWLHSEGDFDGIWATIYWGVKKEDFKATKPRRFEMHPKGGMPIEWEQVRELAAYVWTISRPNTHPLVTKQTQFLELARAGEVDEAIDVFRQAQRDYPEHRLLQERSLNRLGYEFMPARAQMGQKIFELTVDLFPDSWNAYDSLAESYMVLGDDRKAVELYEKSVAMNPENTNGLDKLKELGAR